MKIILHLSGKIIDTISFLEPTADLIVATYKIETKIKAINFFLI